MSRLREPMKTETFQIDLVTPCFCAGAEPDKHAEIRAPSIRGQLRWWFRTLGGFKSLAAQGMSVRDQESLIFGCAAGTGGRAGKLVIRISGLKPSSELVDDAAMNARPGSDRGYMLFPLRPERPGTANERRRDRAVFNKSPVTGPNIPSFALHVLWRGDVTVWEDIRALVGVFGHLGALGFRSRRAMGALAFRSSALPLPGVLQRFTIPGAIVVRQLTATSASDAISVLAKWLKSWRSHGRTGNNTAEQGMPGYVYAKRDHDMAAARAPGPAFRPALGLPIVSKYGDWNWVAGGPDQAKGRFASPVLLRPHRDREGRWHALVIFVDAHKWPDGKHVFLQGQPRAVSLDLYGAMKRDSRLATFP